MDAFDDSVTDQQSLKNVTNKVDSLAVSNLTDGPLTGPASGLEKLGPLVWERKRGVSQLVNNQSSCAEYNIRYNYNIQGGETTNRKSLRDVLLSIIPEEVFYGYERYQVCNFTMQVSSVCNWLKEGGALVWSYGHDPTRTTAKSMLTRQCDMYMTRITDCQKINIPVRSDWFYVCDSRDLDARFTDPGILYTAIRGDDENLIEYKVLLTLTCDVKFSVPTLVFKDINLRPVLVKLTKEPVVTLHSEYEGRIVFYVNISDKPPGAYEPFTVTFLQGGAISFTLALDEGDYVKKTLHFTFLSAEVLNTSSPGPFMLVYNTKSGAKLQKDTKPSWSGWSVDNRYVLYL